MQRQDNVHAKQELERALLLSDKLGTTAPERQGALFAGRNRSEFWRRERSAG